MTVLLRCVVMKILEPGWVDVDGYFSGCMAPITDWPVLPELFLIWIVELPRPPLIAALPCESF